MTTYLINSRVKIADSPDIKSIPIVDILRSTINTTASSTPKLSTVSFSVQIRLTEIDDNDVLIVASEASDTEAYNDITVRALRKLFIDSLNTLCSKYLESVVYEITSLDVIKA